MVLLSVSFPRRTKDRDRLALIAPVDAEILFVDREHNMPWVQLAHPDDTKVGEIGLAVCITQGEVSQVLQVALAVKRNTHNPIAQHIEHGLARLKVKSGFGKHGFAGQSRPLNL
jgi:hypothetical protein